MRFTVPMLAARKRRQPSSKNSIASPQRVSPRAGAFHILLASSQALERELWRSLLDDPNYVVSEVEDGDLALEAILAGHADLVIAAVVMHKVDGLELLRAMQSVKDAPPIVAVTSGGSKIDEVYVKSALLLGAASAHMQPLMPAAFQASVRKVLGFVGSS